MTRVLRVTSNNKLSIPQFCLSGVFLDATALLVSFLRLMMPVTDELALGLGAWGKVIRLRVRVRVRVRVHRTEGKGSAVVITVSVLLLCLLRF